MSIPRMNLFRSVRRKSWLLVLLVLGLLGLTLFDWDEWGFGERRGEKIALAQVPAPVRATIELEAQGGTLKEIEKMTVDGKTAYTASVVVNGSEHEARIGEDGRVLGRGAAEKDDDD
jgi:hypothetical protein